jgi:hypothetical protein
MTPFITAAKDDHSLIVHFSMHSEEAAWTSNIWVRPLLVRNVDSLMIKLSKFIVSLLRFAKPENPRLIQDYEWAGAYSKDGQFIGQLVVTPSFYLPSAQQDFDQLVPLYASDSKGPAVKMQYFIETNSNHEAEVRKDPGEPWPGAYANSDIQHSMR